MDTKKIKTELLCYGIRVDETPDRTGGAGPSDGIFLRINGKECSVPAKGEYVKNSPYILKKSNSHYILYKNEQEICSVERVKKPAFYNNVTQEGIHYYKIFLAHGTDCIGTTVFQQCEYWNTRVGCKFCGIGTSLIKGKTIAVKTPEMLIEVASSAISEGYNHAVLTSGSRKKEHELFSYLAECVRGLKGVGIHIQVQVSPPEDLSLIELLKEAGTDTIAINIESFDERVLSIMAPRKAEIGIKRYLRAMEYSVGLFGKNQVISFILAGLGEERKKMLEAGRILTSIGVYPFIVPLRPIVGTLLQEFSPPSPEYMDGILTRLSEYLNKHKVSFKEIKAGCGRCTCCSPLPDYE